MELGPWAGPILRSDPFFTHIQPLNDIELPGDIAAAIIAERQALNPVFKPYADYMRNVFRPILERSMADTSKQFGTDPSCLPGREQQPGWDFKLAEVFCWRPSFTSKRVASKVRAGEMPLLLAAPRWTPGGGWACPSCWGVHRLSM